MLKIRDRAPLNFNRVFKLFYVSVLNIGSEFPRKHASFIGDKSYEFKYHFSSKYEVFENITYFICMVNLFVN